MNKGTIWTTIVGTGSYIPERDVPNSDFLHNTFYSADGEILERSNQETIDKFGAITDINSRRYVTDDLQTSDIAFFAAEETLASSGIDKETLDYVIVAHNFGDVAAFNRRSDFVPTIAARVKHRLEIQNPRTIAYDLPFGCPGWLQALIQSDYFIKSGDASRALVIGAETLSRISDPHDRDSMIYADGAGACIVEGKTSDSPVGILAHCARSDTYEHARLLHMGRSSNPGFDGSDLFLKMQGHKLYEYALRFVPRVVKECILKAGLTLGDISKVLIHQANAKMDDAIIERVFKLYGTAPVPALMMPMTISSLGNSSVATLPTLLDLLSRGKLKDHRLESGQKVIFVSVGAGMNINAVVYAIP
jgi:3-oxoacyl-[acyl-carrier-protein] synthase-3